MEIFLASFLVFALAGLGLAVGLLVGRPLRRGCGKVPEAEVLSPDADACACGARRKCGSPPC